MTSNFLTFENQRKWSLFILMTLGISLAGLTWFWESRKQKWIKVGHVDKLYVYPMKSGRAKDVPMADFAPMGITSGPFVDRSFMVIDGK